MLRHSVVRKGVCKWRLERAWCVAKSTPVLNDKSDETVKTLDMHRLCGEHSTSANDGLIRTARAE